MSLSLDQFDFLLSAQGEQLLNQLAHDDLAESNSLKLISQLRKRYSNDEASAALTMARLRRKAESKFGTDASRLFFTEDALQQASDPLIRQYRAQTYPTTSVLDLCCGIGSDGLAFASSGARVLGLDLDPVRIAIAQMNAQILGLPAQFQVSDVTKGIPSSYETIFFDPARRDEQGKRLFHVEDYIPPLSLIQDWDAPRMMVKLSPAVDLEQIAPYGGAVEFISVQGDLKEAVLHRHAAASGLQATLLTGTETLIWRKTAPEPDVPILAPQAWLCEPDPALLRATLVRDCVLAHAGALLDETIAYFTTIQKPESAWVRAWQIHAWLPYNLKKLKTYLRERNIGTITVKKRGSPITPEDLTKQLKLKGDKSATLVLTRYQGQAIVIICANFL